MLSEHVVEHVFLSAKERRGTGGREGAKEERPGMSGGGREAFRVEVLLDVGALSRLSSMQSTAPERAGINETDRLYKM